MENGHERKTSLLFHPNGGLVPVSQSELQKIQREHYPRPDFLQVQNGAETPEGQSALDLTAHDIGNVALGATIIDKVDLDAQPGSMG